MVDLPEEDNFHVGYMVRPITGDRSPIMIPFSSLAGGCMMDAYNGRVCKGENGSKIEGIYGPEIIVRVPSKKKNSSRYVLKVSDVPNGAAGCAQPPVTLFKTDNGDFLVRRLNGGPEEALLITDTNKLGPWFGNNQIFIKKTKYSPFKVEDLISV